MAVLRTILGKGGGALNKLVKKWKDFHPKKQQDDFGERFHEVFLERGIPMCSLSQLLPSCKLV